MEGLQIRNIKFTSAQFKIYYFVCSGNKGDLKEHGSVGVSTDKPCVSIKYIIHHVI